MGAFVARPKLRQGESVEESVFANRVQGGRAIGGKLFITNDRLLFVPHRIDKLLGGEVVAIELARTASIEAAVPDGSFFTGGHRRRLEVRNREGRAEMFVVNHVDAVAQRIDAIRQRGAPRH